MPRFFVAEPLVIGSLLDLPAAAARHLQVLRLQPGAGITLFNGGQGEQSGEFEASVLQIGRSQVQVRIGARLAVQREAARAVHLGVGMPANERMDWLVEKSVELGVASIQPLLTERTVLRLSGERALKKQAHWQAIAVAACEQCGRNQVPLVHPVASLLQWLERQAGSAQDLLLLSLQPGAQPLTRSAGATPAVFLSGPEGGLSPAEEAMALGAGFRAVSLGARVLRAETAALAALTLLA